MPNFMLLSRCENVWPFLTLRALTKSKLELCIDAIDTERHPNGQMNIMTETYVNHSSINLDKVDMLMSCLNRVDILDFMMQ